MTENRISRRNFITSASLLTGSAPLTAGCAPHKNDEKTLADASSAQTITGVGTAPPSPACTPPAR